MNEMDPVLEGLTEKELTDMVVNNVRRINNLKEDGKAFAKSVREQVKELEERNSHAIELLDRRKTERVA